MTSKSRKRTQSRRDNVAESLSEQPAKPVLEAPAPIAPNPSKSKLVPSPTASPKLQPDEDSDEEQGKAHLGKNKRPDLIGTRPCERFLNGHCNFGKDCWFVHDVEAREQAKAAGSLSPNSAAGLQLKLGNDLDDPPKPKISLAPTNPWGRKLEDDEFGEESGGENTGSDSSQTLGSHSVANDLLYHMGRDVDDGSERLGTFKVGGSNQSRGDYSRSPCDSSLPPATPSTNPALGVFSVVDMLANVRSGLFEDAISRGVCISCAPGQTHDRNEGNVTSN
eukprot:TRINITY_DN14233_c0_g1_i1.p1 TRINITY_DN14233_c0_g1~~TRINITY_DN14233_c0_g1_i1.p1  ORF type:complete len:278 (-),score=-9.00 TRINITY_DN14233_c0_g1_i1:165-998(-)